VGFGTSGGPVLQACTNSGTKPPASNTATNGNTLVQIGSSELNVAAGPTFRDVTFFDSGFGVLGGGVAVVNAQRVKFDHCWFNYFYSHSGATSLGGNAIWEGGGIALALMNAEGKAATNYTDIKDTRFTTNSLAILSEAADTTIEGGDISMQSGAVGIDSLPYDSIRMVGTHFSGNGKGGRWAIVARGSSAAGKYNGTYIFKVEGINMNLITGGMNLQYARSQQVIIDCIGRGEATRPCIQLDSASTDNNLIIDNQIGQVAFSDGNTTNLDPSGANIIMVGSEPFLQSPVVKVPSIKAESGTRYVCVDTEGKLLSSASGCHGK
jgi:hypothetical protein